MKLNINHTAVFIAASSKSLINFRFDLMCAIQKKFCCRILAYAPLDKDYQYVKSILDPVSIQLQPLNLNNTSLNPFKDINILFKLYKNLKLIKPAIIVAAAIKPVLYSLFIGRLLNIKNKIILISGLGRLYTHQDRLTKFLRGISNCLYRIMLPAADHIFFQNCDDQNLFINLKIVKKNCTSLIPGSGVNLKKFCYTPLASYPPLNFLFIGRFLKEKGIQEYCLAAGIIKKIYPHVCFQVVGAFPHNPNKLSKSMIEKLFHDNHIDNLGEHVSVLPFIQAAHVIVLPSYREGVPKSLLEALSVGRPIITADSPGCRETVIEGVNGYLIEAKNFKSLAHVMQQIITHPAHLLAMGAASHKLAQEKFDVEIVNDIILSKIRLPNIAHSN